MARIALALLAALVGCNTTTSPVAPSLTGAWNIAQPSVWPTFQMTLTQTGKNVSGSALIQGGTTTAASQWNGSYTLHGTAAVDTFALNYAANSDGSELNFYGSIILDKSLRGTLVFRDGTGIDHVVSQDGELDRGPTELHFNK